jgi:hypothetical protein
MQLSDHLILQGLEITSIKDITPLATQWLQATEEKKTVIFKQKLKDQNKINGKIYRTKL